MRYVIYFAQSFPNFRVAELESLAHLNGVTVDLSSHDENCPFLVVELENDHAASSLIKRLVLAKGIYELWGEGTDYASLHADVKRHSLEKFQSYKHNSFRFDILSYMGTKTSSDKIKIIEEFAYSGLEGKIKLKNPDTVFTILEEYSVSGMEKAQEPQHLWFGREVELSARSEGIVEKYDLKKRRYIGTTSFEAELLLVSCNIAQVAPGKIMYDPFAGTGSFLVAAAHFGAYPLGSDIDPRPLKGKGHNTIEANFKQYGTLLRFIDLVTVDFTKNPFRSDFIIDSILCDPPYGVREGLKVCGAKNPEKAEGREHNVVDGQLGFLRKDFIAPKKPYELANLLEDLLHFAAGRLPVGGRLAFWMPTANDEFEPQHIPRHERLELLYALEQEFNKWSRRLVVYVKRDHGYKGETTNGMIDELVTSFRTRYFRLFNDESRLKVEKAA